MTDSEAIALAERENGVFALIEIWRGGHPVGMFTNPRAREHSALKFVPSGPAWSVIAVAGAVSAFSCVPVGLCPSVPALSCREWVPMHQVDPDAGWRSEDVEHLVFPSCWRRFPWIVFCSLSHSLSPALRIYPTAAACGIDVGQPASEVEVRGLARNQRQVRWC
jgi:hypothetical protein